MGDRQAPARPGCRALRYVGDSTKCRASGFERDSEFLNSRFKRRRLYVEQGGRPVGATNAPATSLESLNDVGALSFFESAPGQFGSRRLKCGSVVHLDVQ